MAKVLSSGNLDIDQWTGHAKLIQREFRKLCIQPVHLLNRKVILYKNQIGQANYHLTIDPERPINIYIPPIPHYPSIGEVIEHDRDNKLLIVESVDDENQQFEGYVLTKFGGRNIRYKKSSLKLTQPISTVTNKLLFTTNAGCIYIIH